MSKPIPELGCRDGGCIWGTADGMHTNGGCRCLAYPQDYTAPEWAKVRSDIRRLSALATRGLTEEDQQFLEHIAANLELVHDCPGDADEIRAIVDRLSGEGDS